MKTIMLVASVYLFEIEVVDIDLDGNVKFDDYGCRQGSIFVTADIVTCYVSIVTRLVVVLL